MVCKTSGTGRNRPWLVFRESFKQNAFSGSRKGMIGKCSIGFSGYGFPISLDRRLVIKQVADAVAQQQKPKPICRYWLIIIEKGRKLTTSTGTSF